MSVYPSAPPEYQEYPAMPTREFQPMPAMHMPMPMPRPMPMPSNPPPPPMYYPATPAYTVPPQPTVIFGPESVSMTCPHCNCRIVTETSKTHSACAHCCCILLFCTAICTLCSCLPYCVCDPEIVEHSCPNCHAKLGEWHS